MKLNEQIALLRKQKGLTQAELADAIGVTNQSVSKWESGQCCPDIQLLPKLAEFFGVSIDTLFGQTGNDSAIMTMAEQLTRLAHCVDALEKRTAILERHIDGMDDCAERLEDLEDSIDDCMDQLACFADNVDFQPENGTGRYQTALHYSDREVHLPEILNGRTLDRIGQGWLDQTSAIGRLYLPDTVKQIGREAFRQRDIKAVVFEGSLAELPYQAFYLSGLQEITYPTDLQVIGYECFRGCDLEKIEIPDTVWNVCDRAFYATGARGTVVLPPSVAYVGCCAFYAAKNITDIYVMNPKAQLYRQCGDPEWECAPCFYKAGYATETGYARIHGYKGSTAEAYCEALDMTEQFVPIL